MTAPCIIQDGAAPCALHLWLVDPPREHRGGYDEFTGFVLTARDEADARALLREQHGARTDGSFPWLDDAVVTLLGAAIPGSERSVVLEAFHAG
jgi:hypothetical protein